MSVILMKLWTIASDIKCSVGKETKTLEHCFKTPFFEELFVLKIYMQELLKTYTQYP